jgi:hypothetical protein
MPSLWMIFLPPSKPDSSKRMTTLCIFVIR